MSKWRKPHQLTVKDYRENCFPDLSKVRQKRIDLFPGSNTVMLLWSLKFRNAFIVYPCNFVMLLII